jgi:hypothetical protein
MFRFGNYEILLSEKHLHGFAEAEFRVGFDQSEDGPRTA